MAVATDGTLLSKINQSRGERMSGGEDKPEGERKGGIGEKEQQCPCSENKRESKGEMEEKSQPGYREDK